MILKSIYVSGIKMLQSRNVFLGCLCLFCPTCMEYEVLALQEVAALLSRLEAAEALFPSSKTFGNLFPLYKSKEFIGRVKVFYHIYYITRVYLAC